MSNHIEPTANLVDTLINVCVELVDPIEFLTPESDESGNWFEPDLSTNLDVRYLLIEIQNSLVAVLTPILGGDVKKLVNDIFHRKVGSTARNIVRPRRAIVSYPRRTTKFTANFSAIHTENTQTNAFAKFQLIIRFLHHRSQSSALPPAGMSRGKQLSVGIAK